MNREIVGLISIKNLTIKFVVFFLPILLGEFKYLGKKIVTDCETWGPVV
jgi:hypothetical protein